MLGAYSKDRGFRIFAAFFLCAALRLSTNDSEIYRIWEKDFVLCGSLKVENIICYTVLNKSTSGSNLELCNI
jgi:hypothetical protein